MNGHQLEPVSNISFTGSTRSGKTTLARKLLDEQVLSKLHALVIIGPTVLLSGDYVKYKENDDPDRGRIVKKFDKPVDCKVVVEEIIESQRGIWESQGHDRSRMPTVLIILDDMVGYSVLRFGGLIDSTSTLSRHYNIAIWVLAQRITAVPRTFRLCAKYHFNFQSTEYSELERFVVSAFPRRYRKKVEELLTNVYETPYAYVMVHNHANRLSDKCFINGETNLYEMLEGRS